MKNLSVGCFNHVLIIDNVLNNILVYNATGFFLKLWKVPVLILFKISGVSVPNKCICGGILKKSS